MRRYDIYLRIENYAEDVEAQFKSAKKKLRAGMEGLVAEKKIVLTKAQDNPTAISLSIDEKHLDEVFVVLRGMSVVDVIDAEYSI